MGLSYMEAAVLTDIGLVRKQNQDRYLVDVNRGLFVICDGMGGHRAGEVAAEMAVNTVNECFVPTGEAPEVALVRAILEANRRILLRGQEKEEYYNMGTTITAAYICGRELYVASVGDSRLYIINESGIDKVTNDHTLAEKLFQEGLVGENGQGRQLYRHILTRALGLEEGLEVDLHKRELKEGDLILLTSDGLTDLVEEEEIKSFALSENDLKEALNRMLKLALARGGYDNITMILARVP